MRTIILLAFGLVWAVSASAQVGSSISADGSAPNNNAMLDVKSPSSGAGKGILIPRVTVNQRTNANINVDGGLLDNSGNLRGGAAQGLIVYQTDNPQGLYFNISSSATPSWAYLGDVGGYLLSNVWATADATTNYLPSNVWAAAGSSTNYLPRTGGTMSGALNMGAQIVTNVAHIDFNGNIVSVGRRANGSDSGTAVGQDANGYLSGTAVGILANGWNSGAALGGSADGSANGAAVGGLAKGTNYGAAVGRSANGSDSGAAMGYSANGSSDGVALGRQAIGTNYGAAMGRDANGSVTGAAVGFYANGYNNGVAMGYAATGSTYGAAVGYAANGSGSGAAMGRSANGYNYGAVMGYNANGSTYGVALGWQANGYNYGTVMGYAATGFSYGIALGWRAIGTNYGTAVGFQADGANYGAAMGYSANGSRTNIAIGYRANAMGGTNHIAIGNSVTNNLGNDTAVIRGTLYLDGGSGIYTNTGFGSSSWTIKMFEIDHPLDPQNKILRHYCLEGPQVWNVYAGNAQLVNGQAVVQLPDYYSALNLVGSEICSLTPWGRANVWVAQGVDHNTFSIAGDADVKVSWTVKVLRNDPGCREDLKRRPVEQSKRELDLPAVSRSTSGQAGTGN